jgi:7-cyano-7-deazaguanine synthase in queuosine biosynthesis
MASGIAPSWAAARIAAALLGALEHRADGVDLGGIGGSALTDPAIAVPESPTTGIPVHLRAGAQYAAALAGARLGRGARRGDIFIGVNAVDYSGYPGLPPRVHRGLRRGHGELATRAGVEGQAAARARAAASALARPTSSARAVALGVDFALTVSCYQADASGRPAALRFLPPAPRRLSRPPALPIPRATSLIRPGYAAPRSAMIRAQFPGPLAQSVEQLAFNQLVARSNRARPTSSAGVTGPVCGVVPAPGKPGVVIKWFRNDSITRCCRAVVAATGAVPEGDSPLISPC